MATYERVGATGVTGSGKSYQWLKMAEILKPTGAIFRCLDTDNDIEYMLDNQFPHLKPENGGNVLVFNTYEWPLYRLGVHWLLRKAEIKNEVLAINPSLAKDLDVPLKPIDWTIVDRGDEAWDTVQRYFVGEVFGEEPGEYFLHIRKQLQSGERKAKSGGSPVAEGLDGWKDWSVINKLYADWINPIVYRIHTHVYVTTRVEKIDRGEKDAELQLLYGGMGIRLAGQKKLGNQLHSLFLFIPGDDNWMISTIKDRAGRQYFKKAPLKSFFHQYLVAKAHWTIPKKAS